MVDNEQNSKIVKWRGCSDPPTPKTYRANLVKTDGNGSRSSDSQVAKFPIHKFDFGYGLFCAMRIELKTPMRSSYEIRPVVNSVFALLWVTLRVLWVTLRVGTAMVLIQLHCIAVT